ncbi:hypothetical protein FGB62_285g08 [Gracilaria domingensis]|nr:hypothetical protein FGB62_285g08 [Gracilaria domingensis]
MRHRTSSLVQARNMSGLGEIFHPSMLRDLSTIEFHALIENYVEILVRVHGNNCERPYNSEWISFIEDMPQLGRVVYVQAVYYIYILTQNSEFRYHFDGRVASLYFTVALSLSLRELEPSILTRSEVAHFTGFPRTMIRNGEHEVYQKLIEFRRPSKNVLDDFVVQMMREVCFEAVNPNWKGHRRIRLVREVLLSFHKWEKAPAGPVRTVHPAKRSSRQAKDNLITWTVSKPADCG